jgi:hypothetical protein
MFVISKRKTIPHGMDLKIYRKSIAYPMDLFFVISISVAGYNQVFNFSIGGHEIITVFTSSRSM